MSDNLDTRDPVALVRRIAALRNAIEAARIELDRVPRAPHIGAQVAIVDTILSRAVFEDLGLKGSVA